jgi:hypothetical protein
MDTSTRLVIEAVEEEEDTFPQTDFACSQLDLPLQCCDRDCEYGGTACDSSKSLQLKLSFVFTITPTYATSKRILKLNALLLKNFLYFNSGNATESARLPVALMSTREVPSTSGEAVIDNAVTLEASEGHTVGSTPHSVQGERYSTHFTREDASTGHEEGRSEAAQVAKKRKLLRPCVRDRRHTGPSEAVAPPPSAALA